MPDKRILQVERADDGACPECKRRHIHRDDCPALKRREPVPVDPPFPPIARGEP